MPGARRAPPSAVRLAVRAPPVTLGLPSQVQSGLVGDVSFARLAMDGGLRGPSQRANRVEIGRPPRSGGRLAPEKEGRRCPTRRAAGNGGAGALAFQQFQHFPPIHSLQWASPIGRFRFPTGRGNARPSRRPCSGSGAETEELVAHSTSHTHTRPRCPSSSPCPPAVFLQSRAMGGFARRRGRRRGGKGLPKAVRLVKKTTVFMLFLICDNFFFGVLMICC